MDANASAAAGGTGTVEVVHGSGGESPSERAYGQVLCTVVEVRGHPHEEGHPRGTGIQGGYAQGSDSGVDSGTVYVGPEAVRPTRTHAHDGGRKRGIEAVGGIREAVKRGHDTEKRVREGPKKQEKAQKVAEQVAGQLRLTTMFAAFATGATLFQGGGEGVNPRIDLGTQSGMHVNMLQTGCRYFWRDLFLTHMRLTTCVVFLGRTG